MRARGFTLIEMMVVMVLIGIITTFAVLTLGGNQDPRLETEARRLLAVMELATETAVIQGRELGLVLDAEGYRFSRLENGEWRPLEAAGDPVLRPRELPEDIHLNWEADGMPGQRQPGGEREEDDHRPALLLLSSGEITPFRMNLTWRSADDEPGWLLEGEITGALRLGRAEEP